MLLMREQLFAFCETQTAGMPRSAFEEACARWAIEGVSTRPWRRDGQIDA